MTTVNPVGNGSVTFSSVVSGGTTSFTPIDPAAAGVLPAGFEVLGGNTAYDISTTAIYSPPLVVCFYVTNVNDPVTSSRVRIFHGENGQLVDRTILAPDSPAPDFENRRVCARVDSLSPFVAALAPASGFGISGRVMTPSGQGLRNIVVTLIDGTGARRIATTSSFGVYFFDSVSPGQNYILTAVSKRYRFQPKNIALDQNLSDVDFIGLE